MRILRRLLVWLGDLTAIVVVVACILHFSRRHGVVCDWHGMRASCALEVEDSLGRVEHAQIDGIRGVAYRAGNVVGVVTDASNKDELAFFGTRMIVLERPDDAAHLYAFADDRTPSHLAIEWGAPHPRWLTAALLAALLAYSFLSRRGRAALARRGS